jgi:RNA polymerase sigma factor for flagellar operon FliA
MEPTAMESTAMEPMVEGYLPLVGAIARAMRRRLPASVELDELVSDGVIGLIGALQRYDPARGVGFPVYASRRIRGAMLDGLRDRDPLPRTVRRARRAAHDGVPPSPARGIHFVDLDDVVKLPANEDAEPESLVLEADLRRRLWEGVAALPLRDREVLLLRMVHGLTARMVAERLALSMTRTIEIQQRGLTRLRRFLEGEPMVRLRGRMGRSSAVDLPAIPAITAGTRTNPLETTRHLRPQPSGDVSRSGRSGTMIRAAGPHSGSPMGAGRARPAPYADVHTSGGGRPWATSMCREQGDVSWRSPR